MKKYVIMFKGGVETQEYFSIQMAETFEKAGYEVYWFDLVVGEYSAKLLKDFYSAVIADDNEIIIFTFNFHGIAGEPGLYDDNYSSGSFWSDTGIPVYNMVVDHPLYYHKYMHLLPKNYVQISIDKNHIRYMNRFFPQVRCEFIPLGGTEVNRDGVISQDIRYIPISQRPIDVIFTGNYTPIKNFEKYIAGLDENSQNFYRELVNQAVSRPDELIEDIFEEMLNADEPTDDELRAVMPNVMFADLSARFYYRAKVIAALVDAGIKVHTFGAGWDRLDCNHPENIIPAGSVDSQECLDMISQAKISINVMPWFKDGAHDRIFNTMLNGAVCVTDTSKYLLEQFKDGEQVLFYDLSDIDSMCQRVKELLSDCDAMQTIADAGYKACIGKHTWAERTLALLDIIG